MAYLPSQDTVILQIAKSGSSSLVKAASTLGELTHLGHLPASSHPVASRCIAVVRDPVGRLISALNYYYRPQPVDDALRHALKYRMGQSAFKPQSWYMDVNGIEVYSIDRIQDALSSIGYTGYAPRENASQKWLTLDMVFRNKYFKRILETQQIARK